jgi:acylphosphatase
LRQLDARYTARDSVLLDAEGEAGGERIMRTNYVRWIMAKKEAIEATVTGQDQQVGFRALVMKQAIAYNLAGAARNEPNAIVQFTLQGDKHRIDSALATIQEGTHCRAEKAQIVSTAGSASPSSWLSSSSTGWAATFGVRVLREDLACGVGFSSLTAFASL